MLDGDCTAIIGGAVRRLTPGTTIAMCRKVPHGLVNDGDRDLQMFFWITPPGYEELLASIGRPRRPGGAIPPHAHTRNEEVLLIATSSGQVLLDDVWHEAPTGSLAFVSRWVTHSIRNTGEGDMTIFAVFTPPGLDQLLRAVSRPRVPGEPEPDPATLSLPENVAELLEGSVLALPAKAAAHNREAPMPPSP